MATFERFEDIAAWQKARQLAQEVYRLSNQGAFAKDFGLRDQIRRAGVSVMANIAEGFERDGAGEFIQFLAIAKGSVGELRSHLYVALDQGYVQDAVTLDRVTRLAVETARMVHGLMNYLRSTKRKGTKFQSGLRHVQLET